MNTTGLTTALVPEHASHTVTADIALYTCMRSAVGGFTVAVSSDDGRIFTHNKIICNATLADFGPKNSCPPAPLPVSRRKN